MNYSPPPLSNLNLPPGSRLGAFEIDRVLERTPNAVTYLATDHALTKQVAIEEYLPSRLVKRDATQRLQPISPLQHSVIERGLRAFISEARMLAQCQHPSLMLVLQLMEANGTAYRVTPYQIGQRLVDLRRTLTTPPTEAFLWSLVDGVLGALEALHRCGHAHGGVSPDNIVWLAEGRPLLRGCGAADDTTTQALVKALMSSVVKNQQQRDELPKFQPGAAPTESADITALAQVMRFCMTGVLSQDNTYEPLADALASSGAPAYSTTLVSALDHVFLRSARKQRLDAAMLKHWLHGDASTDEDAFLDESAAAPPTLPPLTHEAVPAHDIHATAQASPPIPRFEPQPAPAGFFSTVPRPADPPLPRMPPSRVAPAAPFAPSSFASSSFDPSFETSGFQPSSFEPSAAATGQNSFQPQPAMRSDPAPWNSAGVAQQTAAAQQRRRWWLIGSLALLSLLSVASVIGGWVWYQDDRAKSLAAQAMVPAVMAPLVTPVASAPAVPPSAVILAASVTAPSPAKTTTAALPASASVTPPAVTNLAASPATTESSATVTSSAAASSAAAAETLAARSSHKSPKAVCGVRTQFSMYTCMQTQCQSGRWYAHPQCARLRQYDLVDD
jgi:hypothetical protein